MSFWWLLLLAPLTAVVVICAWIAFTVWRVKRRLYPPIKPEPLIDRDAVIGLFMFSVGAGGLVLVLWLF